jgi:1,4-alpha-glucan branching enzyme
MTPIERPDYRCGVPVKKSYKLILNSADPKFGGTAEIRKVSYAAQKGECDRRPYNIEFPLPAYCAAVFEW